MTPKTSPNFRASSWQSGRPPLKGWWNASIERDERARRFWDGDGWSAPVYCDDPRVNAERAVAADAAYEEAVIEFRGVAVGDMDLDELVDLDLCDPAADTENCQPGVANLRQMVAGTIAYMTVVQMKLQRVGWESDPAAGGLQVAPLPSYRCTLTPSLVVDHAQA